APARRVVVSGETGASENSFVPARCDTPEGRAERARQVVVERNMHNSRYRLATASASPVGGVRPVPVLPFAHRPRGGARSGRTARSPRTAPDRGGRRLVRVPRGHARPDSPPLRGGRALGVGSA